MSVDNDHYKMGSFLGLVATVIVFAGVWVQFGLGWGLILLAVMLKWTGMEITTAEVALKLAEAKARAQQRKGL